MKYILVDFPLPFNNKCFSVCLVQYLRQKGYRVDCILSDNPVLNITKISAERLHVSKD